MCNSTIEVATSSVLHVVTKAQESIVAKYETVRENEVTKEYLKRADQVNQKGGWWFLRREYPEDYLNEETIEQDLLKRHWLEDSDITLVRAKERFDHRKSYLKKLTKACDYADVITFSLTDFNYLLSL